MNRNEKWSWPSVWQRLVLGGLAGLNLWLCYTILISGKHPLLAIPNGALTCAFLWFLALTWHQKSQ